MALNAHHHYPDKGPKGSGPRLKQDFSAFSDDTLPALARGKVGPGAQFTNSTAQEKTATENPRTAKPKRDRNKISQAMMETAGIDQSSKPGPSVGDAMSVRDRSESGLTLRELEEDRWNVSPAVAKHRLVGVGLPYEGRRAGLIYSWASIFRAEGVEDQVAKIATRKKYPSLYESFIDTAKAAELLGYQDASSIRKMVGSGSISESAYITFGPRPIYRFRPSSLATMRRATFTGRIV